MPAAARTEELTDLVEWLGELVRQVDSSLLDEVGATHQPDQPLTAPAAVPARPRPLTGNERAFTAMVRNALFRRVELFARRRWDALGELHSDPGGRRRGGRRSLRTTSTSTTTSDWAPTPAGPRCSSSIAGPGCGACARSSTTRAGDHDWGIEVEVDLEDSDEEGAAVLQVVEVGRLD